MNTSDLSLIPGGSHPLNQIGAVRWVDVIGETTTRVIQHTTGNVIFRADIDVVNITRYSLLITEVRAVLPLWELAQARIDPSTASPNRLGFRALDTLGREWTRDWDGCHSDGSGFWFGPDDFRGEAVTDREQKPKHIHTGVGYRLTTVA